jgi:hypothetical protein
MNGSVIDLPDKVQLDVPTDRLRRQVGSLNLRAY